MPELLDKLERWADVAERKRDELTRAIEEGSVADPFSVAGVIILAKAIAISAAVSLATAGLTRALTPRQKFTTGQLQGTLQVPQSDLGLPIVEGYGADPGSSALPFQASHAYALEDRVKADGYFYVVTTAGTSASTAPTFPQAVGSSVTSNTAVFTCYGRTGGGFRLPMVVVWTSGVRKHVTKVKAARAGKGPKAPEQEEITYDLDLALMPGRGPLTVKRIKANTDTIYQTFTGESAYYQAEAAGNTKAGGAANVVDALASGGSAVSIPTNGSLQWNSVYGDGTAVILEFYLKTTAPVTVEFTWVGAAGTTIFNADISSTGGVYQFEYGSAPWLLSQGAVNTVKVKNLSASAIVFDRLGVRISGGPTGVPASGIPADDDYDAGAPPSPNDSYQIPVARFSDELADDTGGVKTGTIQAGGYAGISIYPGSTTQLPDPTMEAVVDAQHGAGSTPAFLGRCLIVLSNFFLTKFGGAIPLISVLAEHQTIHTFEAFCDHMGERTGVLESSDYDFSGIRRKFLRGFPVTPPYAPADVMEELARVYNVYFTESDKIRAFERGSQAPVAALTPANLGWVDGESEEDEGQELESLDIGLATETEIARRYELTAVDPTRDFEQNSQGTSRQITRSEKTENIGLALTLYPEEMREVTQRELYEEEIESTNYSGSLDWTYLWVNAGDSVTVTEDDGFTHRIFINSIKPNVGVIPFEGVAEETAVYSQPVSTSGGVFEIPPVPIPGMTILGIWDGPLLSDVEMGINEGVGFYAWGVMRHGDGEWVGAALYVDRGLGYELIQTFETEAVYGVTATTLASSANFYTQTSDALTVDLHNPNDVLESVTYDDVLLGANACVIGDEVCQILTATREPDTATYPNRWYLVIARRGIRNTEYAAASHATGERFVLFDDAIKFIAIPKNELNTERDYKMVTSGQSLDDAAVVSFAWTGNSRRHPPPQLVKGHRNTSGDVLSDWQATVQGMGGIRQGLTNTPNGEEERYAFYVMSDDGLTEHYRWEVAPGLSFAPAMWQVVYRPWPTLGTISSDGGVSFASTTVGSRTFEGLALRSAQVFAGEAMMVFGLTGNSTPEMGFQVMGKDAWRDPLSFYVYVDSFGDVYVEGGGTPVTTAAAGDEIAVWMKNGQVRYYRSDAGVPVTEQSEPFHTSTVAPEDLPYVAVARDPLQGEISFARILRREPEALITTEMQTLKFGGLKNPLRVKVNRISSLVGEGYNADVFV